MAYKLMSGGLSVFRIEDNASIPADPRNVDWQTYQAWLAAGNTPLPADPLPAPVPPKPSPREWLERLPADKQGAIFAAAAGNSTLLGWLFKASGTPGGIDVTAAETQQGVAALMSAGVLTAADQAILLTP